MGKMNEESEIEWWNNYIKSINRDCQKCKCKMEFHSCDIDHIQDIYWLECPKCGFTSEIEFDL